MKKISMMLAFLLFGIPLLAQLKLTLEMKPSAKQFIQCEPQILSIAWQNTSQKNLYIGQALKPLDSPAFGAFIDGTFIKSLPDNTRYVSQYAVSAPDYLLPGEEKQDNYDLLFLNLKPGHHAIKVVADFKNGPENYFQGYAESDEVKFEILPPQGEDQKVVEAMWADLQKKKLASNNIDSQYPLAGQCYFMSDTRAESANFIISKFPNSIYAAWVVLKSLGSPDSWEPAKLRDLFLKGLFPQPTSNSVPYPDWKSGWKDFSGEEYARWQMDWAERILRNHPDFAYAKRLKLLLGVYNLQLKQEQRGMKWLEEVAKDNASHEGQWAQHFIELWKTPQPHSDGNATTHLLK